MYSLLYFFGWALMHYAYLDTGRHLLSFKKTK